MYNLERTAEAMRLVNEIIEIIEGEPKKLNMKETAFITKLWEKFESIGDVVSISQPQLDWIRELYSKVT